MIHSRPGTLIVTVRLEPAVLQYSNGMRRCSCPTLGSERLRSTPRLQLCPVSTLISALTAYQLT